MFYFESIKINSNSANDKNTLSLNLKLSDDKTHIITSKNESWLNDVYQFCKSKKNYETGGWFVDNVNLVKLENNDFKNFLYNKFSFCDENLIINKKWTVKKNLKLLSQLLNKNYNDILFLLDDINLNKIVLNIKINNLTAIEYTKVLILLSLIKTNTKYIFFNFLKLPTSFFEYRNEIIQIIKNITEKYKITTICFVRYTSEIDDILIIDSNKYFYNNDTLTIDDTVFKDLKLSPYKNIFILLLQGLKLYNWKLLELFAVNFFFSIIAIFFLSLKFINNENDSIANFVKNNFILIQVMGYIFYLLTYCHLFFWIWWNWKRINCYNSFLDSIGLTFKIRIIVTPIIIFTTIFISLLIAFIINSIIFINTMKIVNNFWFGLPLLLYIFFLVIFIIFIIIDINKSLKEISFKKMILEIFSK